MPPEPVDVVLVPLQGSWLKTAEAIDFVNIVASRQAIGIHDAQLNERGLSSTNGWLGEGTRPEYHWLSPGTAIDLQRRGFPQARVPTCPRGTSVDVSFGSPLPYLTASTGRPERALVTASQR